MDLEKIKQLLNISVISLLIGILFLFIKWFISVPFILVYFILCGYVNIKYPNECKIINEKRAQELNNQPKKYPIKHISGIRNVNQNQKCYLFIKNIQMYINNINNKQLLELDLVDIKNVCILEEVTTTQKDKSIVARAVVGGLILGPVGAVVGGMSGLVPKIEKNKNYYLEIKSSKTDDIIITADLKTLEKIKKFIVL